MIPTKPKPSKQSRKKPGGRPTKMTPVVLETLFKAIAAGNSRKASAEYAGLSYRTFLNWMKEGERATRGEFFHFFHALTRAEAECEVRNVAIINQAASGVPSVETTTTTRKVVRMMKTTFPDGRVLEEPVFLTLTTTRTTEKIERDWRAALAWLERRHSGSWGKTIQGDIDERITALIEFVVVAPKAEAAPHLTTEGGVVGDVSQGPVRGEWGAGDGTA